MISQSAVLVSHGIVDGWEPGRPASVSSRAIGELRQRCPDVLVISDDLQMKGLQGIMSTREACFAGLEAGIVGSLPTTHPGIANAVSEDAQREIPVCQGKVLHREPANRLRAFVETRHEDPAAAFMDLFGPFDAIAATLDWDTGRVTLEPR